MASSVGWPSTPSPSKTTFSERMQNTEVEAQRRGVHVLDIPFDASFPTERVAAINLGKPGEARSHLKAATLKGGVLLHLIPQRRSRPDDAHLSANNVEQLRKLVEREPPQNFGLRG